jgi:hypothetical protein
MVKALIKSAINVLDNQTRSLDGETKVYMEHTGRYYEPIVTWLSDAGIFVSTVNPILARATTISVLPIYFYKWKLTYHSDVSLK